MDPPADGDDAVVYDPLYLVGRRETGSTGWTCPSRPRWGTVDDVARMRYIVPAMIAALALSAVPGLAAGQMPELFSAVQPDTEAHESLNAQDAYMMDSELAVLNTGALAATAKLPVLVQGDCCVIPSV